MTTSRDEISQTAKFLMPYTYTHTYIGERLRVEEASLARPVLRPVVLALQLKR